MRQPRLDVAIGRRALRDLEHLVQDFLRHFIGQETAHRAPQQDGFVDREHGLAGGLKGPQ
jgi:hypothetical protein